MKKYDYLIGKTREELVHIMGSDQFNEPYSNVWTFYFKENFFKKRYVYIYFDDGVIISIRVIIQYF